MTIDEHRLADHFHALNRPHLSALDILAEGSIPEKMMQLVLEGCPEGLSPVVHKQLVECRRQLMGLDTSQAKVVVFGGGTGLSNIVGGDSRHRLWWQKPFTGLKEVFPRLHSVVCITDDGGSTGELLKDLPLVALGDIRHVLLASVRWQLLRRLYGIDRRHALRTMKALHGLFNYRFISRPDSMEQLWMDTGIEPADLPMQLLGFLQGLLHLLFADKRLVPVLERPQCLGNLFLAAVIYRQIDSGLNATKLIASPQVVRTATIRGLADLAGRLGVARNAVLPCSTTAAHLQILYENGVLVTGEDKSSRARRGVPVDKVRVEFLRKPYPQPEVVNLIDEADIIVLAPGSLYSSIIPVFQFPGLADAVRRNARALKLLVANIWVQQGETDASRDAWERKFYVSDLIQAYHRNIPGGIQDLFTHVLTLNLRDIPGSVLQRYAIEQKEPIYLDRDRVAELGFETIQASMFSRDKLEERKVIKHDPDAVARAVQVLWGLKRIGQLAPLPPSGVLPAQTFVPACEVADIPIPCLRYSVIHRHLHHLATEEVTATSGFQTRMTERQRRWLLERLVEIVWLHPDIPVEHLRYMQGVTVIETACWNRCQEWDNVYSFYDPADRRIKIRKDQVDDLARLEMAFLVALGQSLLGNYARKKEMLPLTDRDGHEVGRLYCLTLCEEPRLRCFFPLGDVERFLALMRMRPSPGNPMLYTRAINAGEGFTPPGLFFGLFYAWYLDNRFAANIEYKMSIMHNKVTDLIPEEVRILERRQKTIGFFRSRVFQQLAIEGN